MKLLKDTLTQKNIVTGYLYFYIHYITELVCFFALARIIGDSIVLWVTPLLYDALAFIPQGLIGYIYDKYNKFNPSIIGTLLMLSGIILFLINIDIKYAPISLIALGNAFIHVGGAETTLKTSNGKLSHPAIFVSGGAFGVVTGKLLGKTDMFMWLFIPLTLTMIPFILLADSYVSDKDNCKKYNYHNKKINPFTIVILATLVVMIRGYMGYGIPTTWNKTVVQTIILFVFMGTGKALGGILSDIIGMKKTALISVIGALPFLLIGDKIMVISLIGVMFFSMTMAVTLGLLVSVLKEKPGLAFGFTTIGLIVGSLPIFFIKITSVLLNCIIISLLSIICLLMLNKIIGKDNKNG